VIQKTDFFDIGFGFELLKLLGLSVGGGGGGGGAMIGGAVVRRGRGAAGFRLTAGARGERQQGGNGETLDDEVFHNLDTCLVH
jgi:hypothetical protein